MRVEKDDDMPPRMKRGNAERPERVPTKGHEGRVPVDDDTWRENERSMDHSREMARAKGMPEEKER